MYGWNERLTNLYFKNIIMKIQFESHNTKNLFKNKDDSNIRGQMVSWMIKFKKYIYIFYVLCWVGHGIRNMSTFVRGRISLGNRIVDHCNNSDVQANPCSHSMEESKEKQKNQAISVRNARFSWNKINICFIIHSAIQVHRYITLLSKITSFFCFA